MMSRNEKGTFEENFLNVCENGCLKKGFKLVMKNINVGCVTGIRTLSYTFTSNFVYLQSKIYAFKERSVFEKEVLSLYSQLQNTLMLTNKNDILPEGRTGPFIYTDITLLYDNKIIYSEDTSHASGDMSNHYNFELLDEKLIRYIEININNKKYSSPNSLDISSLNKNAFNFMGRLQKDYKLSIEHGMETKKGASIFGSYTLKGNDKSCFYTAKWVNTLERILRYQKDIYGEQNNSLIYINIALFYQDKLIFNKKFFSFNPKVSKKTSMTFRMILGRVRRNCNSNSMYFSPQKINSHQTLGVSAIQVGR